MAIVKHTTDRIHASDWLFAGAFIVTALLLIWLAQLIATGIVYLGTLLM